MHTDCLILASLQRAWLMQVGQHLLSHRLELVKEITYVDLQLMQLLDKLVQRTEACKRFLQARDTWEGIR